MKKTALIFITILIKLFLFFTPATIQAETLRNIDNPQIYPSPIISWGNSSYHDSLGVRDPFVVRNEGLYYLYYDCTEDLLNPSFESNLGINGWDVYEATIESTSERSKFGSRSLRINTNNVVGAGAYTGNYYFNDVKNEEYLAMPTGLEVTTDNTYIASAYFWAGARTRVSLWVKQYRDDPGFYWENWITTADVVKEIQGNGQWQRIFVKFRTVPEAKAITVSFVADPLTTTYWDGVQLERVDESVNNPSDFPTTINFNKPLEDTIGWRSCVATSSDGVNFQKLGPLDVTGQRGAWEEFEKPGWVGSSFMYLNPFFQGGYWYAHTWESGYQLDPDDPFFLDHGSTTRRFGYGDRRAFLPTGFARSGLVRSHSLLGPFERLSQSGPITLPEQLPAGDSNSCEQLARSESSTWGCEFIAASGIPHQIDNKWVLFLSGVTSYKKGEFDWDGGAPGACGAHGITSGASLANAPLSQWISTSQSPLFSTSEICQTNIVAEGPIYYFDQESGKHLVFVNDIRHGSIVAFWTEDPFSKWPMEDRQTIITGSQILWSQARDGAIGLPTIVESGEGKLNLYFAARPSYAIREGWKDYLFHDIGLLTIDLPLLPPPPAIPGDANGDGKVDGLDYIIWLKHYNQTTNNGPSDGDFNEDGKVNGLDYVIWLNNYSF